MVDKPKVIEFRSEFSKTVVYACSVCGYTAANRAFAEECCTCKSCGVLVDGGGNECRDCRKVRHDKNEAERHEREWALPVVEDKGEPVFAGERFYETADAAPPRTHDLNKQHEVQADHDHASVGGDRCLSRWRDAT